MGRYEIFRDDKDEFRFRLIARNGKIIATGEGYKRKKGVYKAIESIKTNVNSKIVDNT